MARAGNTTLLGQGMSLPVVPSLIFIVGYFAITFMRSDGWVPQGWSMIPIVETAWLNLLLVLGVIVWMRLRYIPLTHVGLGTFRPSRSLRNLVIGTMAIDYLAIGLVTPVLIVVFGDAEPVARFQELPGNLPLLLLILPLSWVIAFGEEFFFRGFMLTALGEMLGASRVAWVAAVLIQAVAFGLIHLEQGPVQAISIGVGGMVFGFSYLFARTRLPGRMLWPLILAHGLNNTLGLILLYSGAIVR